MKWYDANGTDVDAYPNDAFVGGVYVAGVFGQRQRLTPITTFGSQVEGDAGFIRSGEIVRPSQPDLDERDR